jgi:hypothetical protein
MLFKEKRSSWYFNLFLLVLSTIITIILSEALLHFSPKFRPFPRVCVGEFKNLPSKNFLVDQLTGWRMTPQHQFSWTIDECIARLEKPCK